MIKKDESFVLNGFSARDTGGVILTQTITRIYTTKHKQLLVGCLNTYIKFWAQDTRTHMHYSKS